MKKPVLRSWSRILQYYCYRTVLSGNIWLSLEPEPKIINFGSAILKKTSKYFLSFFLKYR